MLTTAHYATDDRIFYREAAALRDAGYSTCVVGRHPKSEVVDGIRIVALPSAPDRLRRLALGWSALRMAFALNARLYILHDPELLLIGVVLRFCGKHVLYDAHEHLPAQILQKDWIWTPLRRFLAPLSGSMEWLLARSLHGVIAAVPTIQRRFPTSRSELVRNFLTAKALTSLAGGAPINTREDIVIYTGGLTEVRGIRELIEAMRRLSGVRLLLVGSFDDPNFQEEILSRLPSNVDWLGWKSHPDVLCLYRRAKLGVVLLHDTPNHRCALPVKLFEYLGAGLPVIASNFSQYRDLVADCGVQVDPKDADGICFAISRLLADRATLAAMSATASQRAREEFAFDHEGERLISFCARKMARRTQPKASHQQSHSPEASQ